QRRHAARRRRPESLCSSSLGNLDWLNRLRAIGNSNSGTVRRRCPAHSVQDHAAHFRLVIRREGLVTGTEIKHLALPAIVTATTAEDFPTLKPAYEHQRVRFGDAKRLAVHFSFRNFKIIAQSIDNRVRRVHHPYTLALADFAP